MRYFLLFILLFPSWISAQELNQTLRGKITDKESEIALPGATVSIITVDPVIGSSTDANGYFEISKIPIGRHTVVVKFIGYRDAVIPNVLFGSGKEVVLNISIQESYITMNEVVIKSGKPKDKALNEMTTVSARSFSVDEAARYAASIDDPARMAQSFAGVATTDDVSNEIIIRGNSPRGLLWRLNGIEIPSPNHFSDEGTSGGGVSALSNNMLDNSDFLTGAFPAEYGNALSGVFDVKLRKGNTDKNEYAAQIGVLGTDFSAEGPLSKKNNGSFLLNYRYSTLGLLSDLGFLDLGATNTFQDVAFNLNLPTKAGVFNLFGLGGLSKSGDFREADTSLWESPYDAFAGKFDSDMGVIGLSNQIFFGSSAYLKTTIAATAQRIVFTEDSLSPINGNLTKTYDEHFINSNYKITSVFNKKLDVKNTIKTGFILTQLGYNLKSGNLENGIFQNKLTEKDQSYSYQAFAHWKHRFTERLTINAGLHYLGLALTNARSLEPRVGISFQQNPLQRFSFGTGLHSRMESMSIYNARVAQNDGTFSKQNLDLDFSKSWHTVVGYDRLLNESLRVKIELYYQYLFNIPVSTDSTSSYAILNESAGFTNKNLVNEGTGYNAGVEITLEKFFSNRYYYLLTASLFDSKYTNIAGQEFNSRFNNNYRLTLLGGKEFPVGKNDKNLLELNGKFILSGGNRYTPIDRIQSQQNFETVTVDALAFTQQVPDYWRIDISLNYRKNKPKTAHIWSLNIQNATNRINLFGYFYNPYDAQIETIDQFGLLPVLKYRIEF